MPKRYPAIAPRMPMAAVKEALSRKASNAAKVSTTTRPTALRLKGPNPGVIRMNTPISAMAPMPEMIHMSCVSICPLFDSAANVRVERRERPFSNARLEPVLSDVLIECLDIAGAFIATGLEIPNDWLVIAPKLKVIGRCAGLAGFLGAETAPDVVK